MAIEAKAHVAVVGSGPSGFYAAEALLRADPQVEVDILERLPSPFGLVRGGVAPDHPKIKQAAAAYDRVAKNPRCGYFGNVEVGRHVSVLELTGLYHAIILATGAPSDTPLGIPGEELPGNHGAGEFVGWYNGHPDHSWRHFDLSQEAAVIIGQGNVAADICRMLVTPVDDLRSTDMPDYALQALSESRIREIHLIGRRGPAQAKFANDELRELGEVAGCRPVVRTADLLLNEGSARELADPRGETGRKNLAIFRGYAERAPGGRRAIHFGFLASPVEIAGAARVETITLARNRLTGPAFEQVAQKTGDTFKLRCGLVFRSIGFRGVRIEGVPYDAARAIVPNIGGRVMDARSPVRGLYATGWIKRGATGVIGTNRADSAETVKCLVEDLPSLRTARRSGGAGLAELLSARGARSLSYEQWQVLDGLEQRRGASLGKPREKLCSVHEMLALSQGIAGSAGTDG